MNMNEQEIISEEIKVDEVPADDIVNDEADFRNEIPPSGEVHNPDELRSFEEYKGEYVQGASAAAKKGELKVEVGVSKPSKPSKNIFHQPETSLDEYRKMKRSLMMSASIFADD